MNDPHVEALVYRVQHGATVDYDKAEPLEHDTPCFTVRVENGRARFEMKEHYDTEDCARDVVEPYLLAWEVSVGLNQGPDQFSLVFENSEVVDRSPGPGVTISVPASRMVITGLDAFVHISYRHYPEPPQGLAASPDVVSMYGRYLRYRQGNEPLATMAHFCLTVLEASVGKTIKRRRLASERYKISQPVLSKLAHLTSTKGGQEARKASGTDEELTAQDRIWMEATIKALIRRAAEYACDPRQDLQQITSANLPQLE